MLNYLEDNTNIECKVTDVGEKILECLILDYELDENKAADLFFASAIFGQPADAATGFYKKSW
jgi:hypothetical protein